jgi:hypothetical protein
VFRDDPGHEPVRVLEVPLTVVLQGMGQREQQCFPIGGGEGPSSGMAQMEL